MSRVELGRHGQIDSDVSDPLDGLVNLFDVGLVLAVAFLVAGLGLSVNKKTGKVERKSNTPSESQRTLHTPKSKTRASGKGQAVGRVYRLPDGRLVLDDKAR
jgi:hypothetical protein